MAPQRSRMRLFVALDLPAGVRQPLAAWRPPVPAVRWTPPERMHLTLRFVGEADERVEAEITECIRALDGPPVLLSSEGLVGLPTSSEPRVLAVRVREHPGLVELQRAVDGAVTRAGAPPDRRPFLPHITVARFKPSRPARLEAVLHDAAPPVAEGTGRSVSLYRSDLTPGGPRYTPLATAVLGGSEGSATARR